MLPPDPVTEALALLDRALDAAPGIDGQALSATIEILAALRDDVAGNGRPGWSGRELGRLNAILSQILAVRYPLADPPWQEAHQARSALAGLPSEAHRPD